MDAHDKITTKAETKPARARMIILVVVGVAAILLVAVATHHRQAVAVVQMVPSAGGVPQRQVVTPAKVAGSSTVCGGHEVAPTATGCTASGGVIFASPPATLTRNGKDE